MNDDLHNIDDLFRDGLEGHREEVPSSVWDAVNNDLDRKQASFYKARYKRLKKVAFVFVVLCFLGGTYLVADILSKEQTVDVKKTPAMPTNTTSSGNSERKHDQPSESKTGLVLAPEQNEEEISGVTKSTPDASASPSLSTLPSTEMQTAETKSGNKQKGISVNDFLRPVHSINSSAKNKTSLSFERTTFIPAKKIVQKGNEFKRPFYREGLSTGEPTDFSILHFSLFQLGNDPSFINLPSLAERPWFIPQNANSPIAAKSKKIHGFSISAYAAPNLVFDRLEDNNHLAGPGRNRRDARREEQEAVSFSGGLLLNYDLSKNWSLQSGVTLRSTSTSIAPKTVYAKADNNGHTRYELHCSSGYVYISPKGGRQPMAGDSAIAAGTTSSLRYVGIPASLSYRVSAGRFSFLPTVGIGLNILTDSKTTTSLVNASTIESTTATITGLKPTYVDGQIGIGVEYGLGPKLSIGLRPTARFALSPINQETPVRSYQNYLSVETGVRVKF